MAGHIFFRTFPMVALRNLELYLENDRNSPLNEKMLVEMKA